MNPFTKFIKSLEVVLQTPAREAEIYYTVDGTIPNKTKKLYKNPFLITQTTELRAIAYWPDGTESRVSRFELEKISASPAVEITPVSGMSYQFYKGAWEKIPDFVALTPIRRGTTSQINLVPAGGQTSDFGLVFKGHLNVPATDLYLFYLSSDDGSRLLIDGATLIEDDGIHGQREKKAVLALEEGFHPIELHYFQHLGGLGLSLLWESVQVPKEEIGAKHYSR